MWAPAEELRAAVELADARVALWRELLAAPARAAALKEAPELAGHDEVRAQIEALVSADARTSGRPVERRAREAMIADLADALADADRDLVLAKAAVERLDDEPTVRGPARRAAAADRARVHARWDALQDQRRSFATANLRLVGAMVRRFLGRGLDPEDLAQEGSMGLLRAVDRYDHRLGFRFSTYAVWWVRHSMERAIRNRASLVRIPVPTQDALYRLNRVRAEVARREGRSATEAELEAAGFNAGTLRRLDRLPLPSSVVSLHADAFEDEGPRTPVLVDDADGAEQILAHRELVALATTMLGRLRPREAEVLRRRFGLEGNDEETLAEIGTSLRMSRERVRQIQNAALHRMRMLLGRPDPGLGIPGTEPHRRLAS